MTGKSSSSDQLVSVDDRNLQELADAICATWQRGEHEQAWLLFGQLRQLTAPLLLGIARTDGPADEVDELVADTYIGLVRHLEAGKPIGNVKALLRTILKRRIVDVFRHRGRGGVTVVSADALYEQGAAALPDPPDALELPVVSGLLDAVAVYPQADVDDCETTAQITNAILDALPSPEREVLIARYLQELTVPETAAQLGMTEDQVKKCTQRALQQARQIGVEKGLHHDLP